MQLGMRSFRVYCSETDLDKNVRALDESDALRQAGIDPTMATVESADGHRVILNVEGNAVVIYDSGY